MEGLVSYLKCRKNGKKQVDFAVENIYIYCCTRRRVQQRKKETFARMLRSDLNLKIYGKSI